MDRLVTVAATELELHFRPSHRCTATFKITSLIHTMPVAIKLSTTRPSSYSFSPSAVALLPPLSSAVFTLVLLPTQAAPLVSPPDFLYVGTAIAPALHRPNSATLGHFFSSPALPIFQDAALPINLVSSQALRSILIPGSGSSSSLLARIIPSSSPPGQSIALLPGGGNREEELEKRSGAKRWRSRWRRSFCIILSFCGRAKGSRDRYLQ